MAGQERAEDDGGPPGDGRGGRPAVPVHVLFETVPDVHGAAESRARAHPRKAVRVFGVRQVFPHQVQPDRTHEGLSRHGHVGMRLGRSPSVHVQDPIVVGCRRRVGVRVTSRVRRRAAAKVAVKDDFYIIIIAFF